MDAGDNICFLIPEDGRGDKGERNEASLGVAFFAPALFFLGENTVMSLRTVS